MNYTQKIAFASVVSAQLLFASAHASEQKTTINFSSQAKSEIANDEMRASFTKTTQGKTTAIVANELTKTINQALQIAKRYPNVTVTTGSQHTYPRYNKDGGQIVGFTGSATLNLRSHHFEQASQLMADLQPIMALENITFGVSDKLQEQAEKQLKIKAIEKFQEDAQTISQAFGATTYHISNVQLGEQSSGYYPVAAPMMASFKTMDASRVETQEFQVGNTVLNYNISGTIELVK